MAIQPKEFYLPFIKKEKVAKDTYSFYWDSANIDLNFLPGQYVRMTLNIKNRDNRGSSRFFTIASSPLEKEHIMITTKIVENKTLPFRHSGKPVSRRAHPESPTFRDAGQDGYQTVTRQASMTAFGICSSFKKKLLGLKMGDMVKFFGPMGGFILNEEEKNPRVFLAGGIGITPFHSMITYAYSKNLSIPITLIVSFSSVEDLAFHEELSNIAKENSYIKTIYTITHPNVQWKGETGRISEGLIKKYVQDIFKPQYFIVGPPAMVAAIEEVVRNMGAVNEKIFIENFTGY